MTLSTISARLRIILGLSLVLLWSVGCGVPETPAPTPPERRTPPETRQPPTPPKSYTPPLRASDSSFPVKETEVSFRGWLEVKGSETPFFLMGVGLRKKTFLQVKVYTLGLYIDPKIGQQKLATWRGKDKVEIAKDPTFYETLLKREFSKAMRLVMVRDVDGNTMRNSFQDSLTRRIEKLLPENKQAAAKEALKTFKTFFKEDVKVNDEILLTGLADGTLHVKVQGKHQGSLQSKDFIFALFNTYLGAEPSSEGAKKDFASGVSDLYTTKR